MPATETKLRVTPDYNDRHTPVIVYYKNEHTFVEIALANQYVLKNSKFIKASGFAMLPFGLHPRYPFVVIY